MRTSVKRKLYASLENIGSIGMFLGLASFGVTSVTADSSLILPSSFLAVSGLATSYYGEKLKDKEDMKLGNYYIDNKTRRLTLKK